MKKSLILTGMMGSGKSTIGTLLSLKLKMKFIDIDKLIEKNEGASINNIFKSKGESYFRNLEEKISLKFIKKNDLIVSLGGGAFMNPLIRASVLKNCISFWLNVAPQILAERVARNDKRPLLKGKSLDDNLHKILLKRKEVYNLANYKINCSELTKETILKKIIKIYE